MYGLFYPGYWYRSFIVLVQEGMALFALHYQQLLFLAITMYNLADGKDIKTYNIPYHLEIYIYYVVTRIIIQSPGIIGWNYANWKFHTK